MWKSLRLGSLAGIPIRIHVTFVFFLAWVAMSYSLRGVGASATFEGIALVLCVFAAIVVHELGHALVARRYGIHTREILLLPIGGVASLERIPEKPSQELAVALVGPAINLAIAQALYFVPGAFALQLLYINIGLALFNLIPAFPMDGGRVLRSVLAMRMGNERATDIAAQLGKVFAVVFVAIGLVWNIWLVVIAFVVWIGARHEATMVEMRSTIHDVPVSEAMNRMIDVVTPDESLNEAARLLVTTGQMQLPIVDHGETVGVLTKTDVAEGIRHNRATIADTPHHRAISVAPSAPLEGVFDRLAHDPDAIAVVIDRGMPIGVVTADQLATFVALHHPSRS